MTQARIRGWRIGTMLAALALCLWIGWRDFDPWIAQNEVREAIRLTIRRGVQIAVQFVAPVALVALLLRELDGLFRARRAR